MSFPSLGTAANLYPIDKAASIALAAAIEYLQAARSSVELITFVLPPDASYEAFARALTSQPRR